MRGPTPTLLPGYGLTWASGMMEERRADKRGISYNKLIEVASDRHLLAVVVDGGGSKKSPN